MAALRTGAAAPHRCRGHVGLKLDSKTKNSAPKENYDTEGNLVRVTPPAPLGATTIAYDGLSRPVSVTDGKGQVTTTAYDALDRVTQTSFAGGLTVTYD